MTINEADGRDVGRLIEDDTLEQELALGYEHHDRKGKSVSVSGNLPVVENPAPPQWFVDQCTRPGSLDRILWGRKLVSWFRSSPL